MSETLHILNIQLSIAKLSGMTESHALITLYYRFYVFFNRYNAYTIFYVVGLLPANVTDTVCSGMYL